MAGLMRRLACLVVAAGLLAVLTPTTDAARSLEAAAVAATKGKSRGCHKVLG